MRRPVSGLEIELTRESEVTIVRPVGELDVRTFRELRDTLLKCAVELPDLVVVLMDGLVVEHNHLYSVFVQAWMRVSDWPGVPIMLVATDRERRRRLSLLPATRYVPVHASIRDAVAAGGDPPARRRAETKLPAQGTASPLARRFVADICGKWGLSGLTGDAAAIATEFVENTLRHTESAPVLRLELRRGLLTVAVADESPHPAVLKERGAGEALSLGLLMVAQSSKVWGCTPTLLGGKVTWAVLSSHSPEYELPGKL